MNLDFSLGDHRTTEGTMKRLFGSLSSSQRITSDSLGAMRGIALGDLAVSTDPRLYHTDHQAILYRAALPYSNGAMWFEGVDGLAHQMGWVLGLGRLKRIRQLSLLGYPVKQGFLQCSTEFNHDRELHTYDVYVIGMLCAHNLGIQGKDLLALRVSLLIHDLFTAACGDLMKFVDRKAYDEDELLTTLLSHDRYLAMCKDLGIDPKEPIRIAQKKDGILCAIRDFADTLAYVARDLYMFQGMFLHDMESWYEEPEDQGLEAELRKISRNPASLDLWQHVRLGSRGNIVVEDHGKLHGFLFARACLFRLLYYHRQTRNVEYILGIRLVKMLLDEGILKYEDFFGDRGTDDMIWLKVTEVTGFPSFGFHMGDRGKTEKFDTLEQAQAHIDAACKADDEVIGLIYAWPSATKTKVNMWNVVKGGKEMPWGEAYPDEAQRIEGMMKLHKGYFAAVLNKERIYHLKPKYWQKLRELTKEVV